MSDEKAYLVARQSDNEPLLLDSQELLYDFYATDLSVAFDAMRTLTEQENLTPSTITMQKYPEIEHVTQTSKKTDENGEAVTVDRVKEKNSDIHWVLSFEWKTKDPTQARCLTYYFYDNGWPCSAVFLLADDEASPVIESGEIKFPNEGLRRFELTLSSSKEERLSELGDALMDIVENM